MSGDQNVMVKTACSRLRRNRVLCTWQVGSVTSCCGTGWMVMAGLLRNRSGQERNVAVRIVWQGSYGNVRIGLLGTGMAGADIWGVSGSGEDITAGEEGSVVFCTVP